MSRAPLFPPGPRRLTGSGGETLDGTICGQRGGFWERRDTRCLSMPSGTNPFATRHASRSLSSHSSGSPVCPQTVSATGTVHAVLMWWNLHLDEVTSFSTAPSMGFTVAGCCDAAERGQTHDVSCLSSRSITPPLRPMFCRLGGWRRFAVAGSLEAVRSFRRRRHLPA